MNKQQIIKELRKIAKYLKKSPGRREIPYPLYKECIKQFKYFNKAKQIAGLKIHRKNVPIPKKAYKLDKDLAKIAAYLTTDGHIYKNLRAFIFFSKDINKLKELENLVYKKFKLKGKYRITKTGFGDGKSYWIFNTKATKLLNNLGVPAGDKMLIKFDVPNWIKNNKQLSREYLKTCFYCEGSKYKVSKNSEAIKINFNKSEELLNDGLKFMDSLKELLKIFNIETTKTWICKGNLRKKDNKITKLMAFKIKANHNNKFIKEIGWIK